MIKYSLEQIYFREEFAPSTPGKQTKKTYQLRYDENGTEMLVETGETNIYEEIQVYKDSVDVNKIIERFAAGDENALARAKTFYADVTKMPVKLMDVLNLAIDGEQWFDTLPIDVKETFGNNFREFLANPQKMVDVLEKRSKDDVRPEQKTEVKSEPKSEVNNDNSQQ